MKTSIKLGLLGSVALGIAAWTLTAQDAGDSSPNRDRPPRREDGASGPGRDGQRPMLPLIAALDANHDGVIDADEIKNAAAALAKLDKNGDGKLTREEFMGRPSSRPDGPPPGGSSDRSQGSLDSRLDETDRPLHRPDGESGDFRPPRDDRGPGAAGARGPGFGRGPGAPGDRGPGLSAQQVLEKFDVNKDGKLNQTELAAFLKDMQSHRPPAFAGGPRPGGPPPEDGPPR
jgi:hypothetical protein